MNRRSLSAYLSRGLLPHRGRQGRAYLVDVEELREAIEARRQTFGDLRDDGRAPHAPREPGLDGVVRSIVAQEVAERVDTLLGEVEQVARAAVRDEVDTLLGDLPERLVKLV